MKTKKLLLTSCFCTIFIASTSYAGFMCDWFGWCCDSTATQSAAPDENVQAPVVVPSPTMMQEGNTNAAQPTSPDSSSAEKSDVVDKKGLLEEAADALDKATNEVKQDVDSAAGTSAQ